MDSVPGWISYSRKLTHYEKYGCRRLGDKLTDEEISENKIEKHQFAILGKGTNWDSGEANKTYFFDQGYKS